MGVETFVPKYKERRSNAFTGRPIYFVIRDGPLTNLVGVFERDLEDGERVLMLLTAISSQGHVTIERELLKKIS